MRKIQHIMIYVVGEENGKPCNLPAQVIVDGAEDSDSTIAMKARVIITKAVEAFLSGKKWDG